MSVYTSVYMCACLCLCARCQVPEPSLRRIAFNVASFCFQMRSLRCGARSGENIPRLLEFVAASRRPAVLLLPAWVSRKPYFRDWLRGCVAPQHAYCLIRLFVCLRTHRRARAHAVPDDSAPAAGGAAAAVTTSAPAAADASRRVLAYVGPAVAAYNFVAPPWARAASEDGCGGDSGGGDGGEAGGVAVRAGYFSCVWFLALWDAHEAVMSDLARTCARVTPRGEGGVAADALSIAGGAAVLACDIDALPDTAPAPRISPAERRWRKKLRRQQVVPK